MARYFLHLSYDGSRYRGWQTQAHVRSVQATIEQQLSKRLKRKILIHGCGRTDAEVHASQYFAHVDLAPSETIDLTFVLNKMLPDDIVLHELIPVEAHAHAQRHAVSRTYVYRVHGILNPFLRLYSYHFPHLNQLDAALVDQALACLMGQHDFSQLCRRPDKQYNPICTIYRAQWQQEGNNGFFIFEGNHFIRSMVRIIVDSILRVGLGELTIGTWSQMIDACCENPTTQLAPGHGLYLAKVTYPHLDRPNLHSSITGFDSTT